MATDFEVDWRHLKVTLQGARLQGWVVGSSWGVPVVLPWPNSDDGNSLSTCVGQARMCGLTVTDDGRVLAPICIPDKSDVFKGGWEWRGLVDALYDQLEHDRILQETLVRDLAAFTSTGHVPVSFLRSAYGDALVHSVRLGLVRMLLEQVPDKFRRKELEKDGK